MGGEQRDLRGAISKIGIRWLDHICVANGPPQGVTKWEACCEEDGSAQCGKEDMVAIIQKLQL